MNSNQISKILHDKHIELSTRISAIEADFKKGRSADFTEQTSERENDEVLDAIHQEAALELRLVKEALARLENGQYGKCSECHGDILPERLSALPYTQICINCAT